MNTPFPLAKGDTIGIISTARKIREKEIRPALKTIQDWGFEVVLGKTIGADEHQFAGNDDLRAADLQAMLDDPGIKAVLCARGGYGTVRIIDKIDFENFRKNPKWVAGFSDVTVLHSHIHQHFGIPTIHSTMPLVFHQNTDLALNSLKRALTGRPSDHSCAAHPLNRSGVAEGLLVGGNLSILYSLTGTDSDLDTKGKILMIEDLDEYLYHIDRMMMNLKKAGKLDQLGGLVVGGMSEMNDNENPYGLTAEEIIREQVEPFDYPVCFGFPAGHVPDNRACILGKSYQLSVAQKSVSLQQKD